MTDIRLQRYISMGGTAARRKGEQLITAGRVKVNGVVVSELGAKVNPARDQVTVDGEAVYPQDLFYVILNKPKGCITSVSDDQGRAIVMDYLPNLPVKVKPVGRLDYYSEGVLLLTNDGELASRLLSPQRHVAKTYHVKVRGKLSKRELSLLASGVRLEDGSTTKPAEITPLPGESKHSWVAITLFEGKSRQIHRMMEALGFEVTKLQRVAFGSLTYHGLRVGDARELHQDELNELRDSVGLPRGGVARGKWKALREDSDVGRRARQRVRDEAEANALALEAGRAEAAVRDAAPKPRTPTAVVMPMGPAAKAIEAKRELAARAAAARNPQSRGAGRGRSASGERGADPRRSRTDRDEAPSRTRTDRDEAPRRSRTNRDEAPSRTREARSPGRRDATERGAASREPGATTRRAAPAPRSVRIAAPLRTRGVSASATRGGNSWPAREQAARAAAKPARGKPTRGKPAGKGRPAAKGKPSTSRAGASGKPSTTRAGASGKPRRTR